MANHKWVRVFPEDHEVLKDYLLLVQLKERRQMKFPDLIHYIIEKHVKPHMEELKKEFGLS